MQISASKFSVLNVEEVEEGEISVEEQYTMEVEVNEVNDQSGMLERSARR